MTSNPADRRRSTRVVALGRIKGAISSLGTPLVVREISLGGMSVETVAAFPVGTVNEFLLTLGDGAGVEVLGKVVYSRPFEDLDQRFFVSGIQFIDQDELDPSTPVGGVIERLR